MDAEMLNGLAAILGYILVVGGIPVLLARNKKRGILLPFLLGIFLGPLGWGVVVLMKPPPSEEELEILKQKIQDRTSKNDWV